MVKLNLEDAIEIMERRGGHFGLRGASQHDLQIIESGKGYLEASLDTWGERDCPYDESADRLNGTSAIAIDPYMDDDEIRKCFDLARGYADNHHGTGIVLFVRGDCREEGFDDFESVLKCDWEGGAEVIAEVSI